MRYNEERISRNYHLYVLRRDYNQFSFHVFESPNILTSILQTSKQL
jgi:hypothetical protein